MKRETNRKMNLDLDLVTEKSTGETPENPKVMQRNALAEAITTTMSNDLEPLLAAKETKKKPIKYCDTSEG